MKTVTLEIVMPVPELTPEQIVKIVQAIGAKSLGGYAEFDPAKYCKGARFMGSLIAIGSDKFTMIWNDSETKLQLQPVEWKKNYTTTEAFSVTVTGLTCGDVALFKSENDAKEYLNKLSSIEQLKLSVKSPTFTGAAVMFLAEK